MSNLIENAANIGIGASTVASGINDNGSDAAHSASQIGQGAATNDEKYLKAS